MNYFLIIILSKRKVANDRAEDKQGHDSGLPACAIDTLDNL